MKTKIFIDGSEGTTGLRINERFLERDDIELLRIAPELRKDTAERRRLINESQITFLCLPDDAARESAALAENPEVRIIDASTAHRTADNWVYGFPELEPEQRDKIKAGHRITVPGCHATGFISLVYPLISRNILPADYPLSSFSLTGYSGAGKSMIAKYNDPDRTKEYDAPREYALSQQHKHLREMKAVTGLAKEPLFSPVIADFYSGMLITVPFYTEYLKNKRAPEELHEFFSQYYAGQMFVQVMPYGIEAEYNNFIGSNICSGWDGMKIYITGNTDRVLLMSQFDNLGKGASGAAIQCLNIMLGCEEDKGLVL